MVMDQQASRAGGERLSALLDGELDATEASAACRQWQGDAECRQTWHAWHVIADVLRSDELAHGAYHDARFLAALRVKLAGEPVVLAPQPLPESSPYARRRRGARFLLPLASAAALVLVAGTFVAMQPSLLGPADPGASGRVAAAPATANPSPGTQTVAVSPANPAADAQPAASIRLIRDARLDRYLAAHKQFPGSTVPGDPSATLRNATVRVEGR